MLGLVPCAAPHAHRRVLRAAHREQRPEADLLAERFQTIAPLRCALVVVDAFTGRNQVAARQTDQHAISHLACEHGRVHFVELLETFDHRAGSDASEAVHGAADHLVVHGARRLSDTHDLGRQLLRLVGIAVVEERPDAGARSEPGVLGSIGQALEETPRPLQPAVGHRLLAAERRRVPRQPHRQSRRAQAVAALAIAAVGALARVEHDVGKIEPPRREAKTFERLGTFLQPQHVFERLVRGFPLAVRQRVTTGDETCGHLSWRGAVKGRIRG